jgi:hypothetical protein
MPALCHARDPTQAAPLATATRLPSPRLRGFPHRAYALPSRTQAASLAGAAGRNAGASERRQA